MCNYVVAHWEGIVVEDRIEREVVIAAPPERVWEIITQAEHVGTWFGDSAEIDLRPGGTMVLRWEKHGTQYATIENDRTAALFLVSLEPGGDRRKAGQRQLDAGRVHVDAARRPDTGARRGNRLQPAAGDRAASARSSSRTTAKAGRPSCVICANTSKGLRRNAARRR